MKQTEMLAGLHKMNLIDLKAEVAELEKQIQNQKFALAFGKTKEVRTIRNLKRQLARTLTIANQKIRSVSVDTQGTEK